ncbi:MAG: hypothetical protein Q9182_004671 [Xanthomendoza sp. 2 TL-2023]
MIQWRYADAPQGGFFLATSILMEIYEAWKDTANRPLTKAIMERPNPFDEYEFKIQPSLQPGTGLTPVKYGLAFCWILHQLLALPRWPGHARATILQSARLIGAISIDNDPLVLENTPAGSNRTHNSSSTELLTTGIQTQQRWLRCLFKAVVVAIGHSPTDRITDDPSFSPQQDVHRYPFPCGNAGVADRVDLFIYPDANAGSPRELTWRKLMTGLLFWIINVARGRDVGKSTKIIEDRRLIAELSIFIQRG